MKWYFEVLQKYAVFDGRASRTEFWMFALFSALISSILPFVGEFVEIPNLAPVYGLVVLLPSLAVTVRRLHDTERSGWWLFVVLVPCIGAITLLMFMIEDGAPGRNKYGVNPKPQNPKSKNPKSKAEKSKTANPKKTSKRKKRK
jgi:uncharacterized membrane protein YhaH (DUF805 family)